MLFLRCYLSLFIDPGASSFTKCAMFSWKFTLGVALNHTLCVKVGIQ